ncbi:MAG TPA: tRNA preQ1(34) S-adenosylmethionine ribosyltransferase-isomerase QueA [Pyrinomonadaceae bacterium]|nr:tRNA preQ1(34) S-adenosylmethionine ribosyltransferase-isomerase QueA [Pyrinomonadaceae bacterium]
MKISDFNYELPPELIAQQPLERRDASRMLVIDRRERTCHDSEFSTLPSYLKPTDLLVLNDTRVFPARLHGKRDPTGGATEVFLVQKLEESKWEALVRPAHRLKAGSRVQFGDELQAEVIEVLDMGLRVLRFESTGSFEDILDRIGETPLPPYIKRPEGSAAQDRERYQTIYASSRGAVAAPTAGLHFSEEILSRLQNHGADIARITLHVGYGTFEPVRVEEIAEHHVAAETFEIGIEAAAKINQARDAGKRIIAVGTTTTRALESAVDEHGQIVSGKGSATLTITPGYEFKVINGLITNFHLPQSSLLLLVSAFAGRKLILDAYRHAVQSRYRFYSYGDCMLIL